MGDTGVTWSPLLNTRLIEWGTGGLIKPMHCYGKMDAIYQQNT